MFQAINMEDVTAQVGHALANLGHKYTLTMLKGRGPRRIAEFTLPEVCFGAGTSVGDLKGRLYLLNENTGRASFQFKVGFLRLVCSNGLCVGQDVFDERLRHVTGPKLNGWLGDIPGIVARAVASLQVAFASLERATTVPVAPMRTVFWLQAQGLVSNSAATAALAKIVAGAERPEDDVRTAWGLYNLVNECERFARRSPVTALRADQGLLQAILARAAA